MRILSTFWGILGSFTKFSVILGNFRYFCNNFRDLKNFGFCYNFVDTWYQFSILKFTVVFFFVYYFRFIPWVFCPFHFDVVFSGVLRFFSFFYFRGENIKNVFLRQKFFVIRGEVYWKDTELIYSKFKVTVVSDGYSYFISQRDWSTHILQSSHYFT